MIGERDRADALDGEHAYFLAEMAVADEIQAAAGKAEKIRIDFAPSGPVARGGVITHLRSAPFVDRLGDQVDGLPVLAIVLVRAEPNGKCLLHRANVFM